MPFKPSLFLRLPRAWLLLLAGAAPLLVALVSQYGFGLPPCHFCLLQRYPYLLPIAAGGLLLWRAPTGGMARLLVVVGGLGIAASGGIGAYHTGIERGWIPYQGGCVADAAATGSLEDLRAQILQAPTVSCSDAMASFAGLSMASWNTIYAFGMIVLILLHQRPHRRLP